jgi:hypothetical protein
VYVVFVSYLVEGFSGLLQQRPVQQLTILAGLLFWQAEYLGGGAGGGHQQDDHVAPSHLLTT